MQTLDQADELLALSERTSVMEAQMTAVGGLKAEVEKLKDENIGIAHTGNLTFLNVNLNPSVFSSKYNYIIVSIWINVTVIYLSVLSLCISL